MDWVLTRLLACLLLLGAPMLHLYKMLQLKRWTWSQRLQLERISYILRHEGCSLGFLPSIHQQILNLATFLLWRTRKADTAACPGFDFSGETCWIIGGILAYLFLVTWKHLLPSWPLNSMGIQYIPLSSKFVCNHSHWRVQLSRLRRPDAEGPTRWPWS